MPTTRLLFRPRRAMLATAWVATLLATSPVFAVLYWLTSDDRGVWIPVLVVHLTLFFLGVGVFLRQLAVFCRLSDDELSGNGIFSPVVRVRVDDIAEVIVVPTHVGVQSEPAVQYLMLDASGRRLFRLRGNYWNEADVEELLEALPVEPVRVTKPMRLREFWKAYPGSAYWFEDKPWLQVLGIAAMLAVVVLVLLWAMTLVSAGA